MTKCRVYSEYCDEHGFHHGAEAEELREGIEKLMDEYDKSVPISKLQRLLDDVDARDSVAYLEAEEE